MKIIKHGPKPKPPHVVTAASTRARDPVARMPHGKHDVRSLKISGTGLPRVEKHRD